MKMHKYRYYCGVDTHDKDTPNGKCAIAIYHRDEDSNLIFDQVKAIDPKDFDRELNKMVDRYRNVWLFDESLRKLLKLSDECM